MKRVYVDGSDQKRLITVVVNGEQKTRWYSTFSYGEYDIETHEAEYLAIIFALEEIPGDLEVLSDSQSIIEVLKGEGKIKETVKPYIERIRELGKKRFVEFSYCSRDFNEAGLKQEGFSLVEIRDKKLKEMMMRYRRKKRRRKI